MKHKERGEREEHEPRQKKISKKAAAIAIALAVIVTISAVVVVILAYNYVTNKPGGSTPPGGATGVYGDPVFIDKTGTAPVILDSAHIHVYVVAQRNDTLAWVNVYKGLDPVHYAPYWLSGSTLWAYTAAEVYAEATDSGLVVSTFDDGAVNARTYNWQIFNLDLHGANPCYMIPSPQTATTMIKIASVNGSVMDLGAATKQLLSNHGAGEPDAASNMTMLLLPPSDVVNTHIHAGWNTFVDTANNSQIVAPTLAIKINGTLAADASYIVVKEYDGETWTTLTPFTPTGDTTLLFYQTGPLLCSHGPYTLTFEWTAAGRAAHAAMTAIPAFEYQISSSATSTEYLNCEIDAV